MATEQPSIRILKPGTFTDIHGTKVTFSTADLADVVSSYDAASDPAPLVVGHPKHDDPAYGWVGGLRIDGEHIVATPSDVAPEFAEAVRKKSYRKVSASLYPPAHPSNPKPGRWYLKHIGFLGASAPGVKGLGTVAFSDADDASAFTLPFDQEPPMTDTTNASGDPAIALAERETAITATEASLAEREAAIAAREEAADKAVRHAQHGENVAFAEGLIAAGTLAPAGKERVIGLMDQLEAAATVSFGEGDAASMTPLAAFRSLFDSAAPVVSLGEHASADKAVKEPAMIVSFSAPAGYTVAPDNAAHHARARAIQAENPSMAFWDAFTRARAEG